MLFDEFSKWKKHEPINTLENGKEYKLDYSNYDEYEMYYHYLNHKGHDYMSADNNHDDDDDDDGADDGDVIMIKLIVTPLLFRKGLNQRERG